MIVARRITHLVAVLFILSAASAFAAPPVLDEPAAVRGCATDESGSKVTSPDMATIDKWIRENRIAAGGVIPVNFHVISGRNNEGNVPESWLDAQITVLNNNYAGKNYGGTPVPGAANTGYTFVKNSVTRTNNRRWFAMTPGSSAESQAKNALVVNPTGSLNFYTCKPGQGLLGWATFPWSLAGNPNKDGIVVHYASLPGGSLAPFNLGGTGSHEVGHWVGLYHTFQGGCHSDATCASAGDLVCDTPAEGTPTSGCPAGKNTCSGAGLDPIHNYMDYSTDICYDNFTPGQDARADFMMSTYRPVIGSAKTMLKQPQPTAARETALRVAPNPFNPTTTFDFSLPRAGHVSLHVYDVAGRDVATVIEGERPAGDQRAVFNGSGLPSGIYMAILKTVDGVSTQRLVMLK